METVQNLTVTPPLNPNTPPENIDEADSKGSGGYSSNDVAAIVLTVIMLALVAAAGLVLMFRARTLEDDEEDEEDEEEEEEMEMLPEQTKVPDHSGLPPGGQYDQTTGVTWYLCPDGSRWWQDEDGSFLLDHTAVEIAQNPNED